MIDSSCVNLLRLMFYASALVVCLLLSLTLSTAAGFGFPQHILSPLPGGRASQCSALTRPRRPRTGLRGSCAAERCCDRAQREFVTEARSDAVIFTG